MADIFAPDDAPSGLAGGERRFDIEAAVDAHCALFNQCFRSGDWSPFVATFADDARMAFTNVPIEPIIGREAIAVAYATNPPTDTMRVLSVQPLDSDGARVRFGWDAGGDGTMVVRWRDGLVADLEITFD
jgi:steroid Delta-isomerase